MLDRYVVDGGWIDVSDRSVRKTHFAEYAILLFLVVVASVSETVIGGNPLSAGGEKVNAALLIAVSAFWAGKEQKFPLISVSTTNVTASRISLKSHTNPSVRRLTELFSRHLEASGAVQLE